MIETENTIQNTNQGSRPTKEQSESGFNLGSFYILVGVIFLLPIFFLPFISSPFQLTKTVLVLVGVLLAFGLFVMGRLKEGSVSVPLSLVVVGAWFVPVTYFFSALFSPSSPIVSLMGQGFETGTVFFVTIGALLLTLVALIVREKQQILGIYAGFLFIFLLLTLFQGLRLIFGIELFSLDIFNTSTSNLIGKWNDLAIFFGLTGMLALITLEGLKLHNVSKTVLYCVLLFSLVFLSIINFTAVWVVFGIFALAFFIYNLLKGKFLFSKQPNIDLGLDKETPSSLKMGSSVASLVVLGISILFVAGGTTVGDPIGTFFGINQLEVRPSWESTVDIARATYADNLIFGSGPNTFSFQWVQFKPSGINNTAFWNTDFDSGIGFVPTAFVTTGILGGIAWIIFFGIFLYSGVRSLLFRPMADSFDYYLSLSSFLVALYLWVFTVIYIPNAVILFLAFFFTGLYVASLRHRMGELKERTFVFSETPRIGFIFVLGLTVVLIFTGVGIYLVGDRYLAAVHFQQAIIKLGTDGDEIEARRMLAKARDRVNSDAYARLASEIELLKLSSVLADTSLSPEEQRIKFEEVLGSAIENAQEARDISPNNYNNWFTVGRVYQSILPLEIQGSYENAKEAYEHALLYAPHNPNIYLALAELEVLRNDNIEARSYIQKALEEKENYTAAVFLLAQIQVNEGKILEAIRSVESASILEPNNPVAFFQLGLLKYNQNDWAGAVGAFERAVSLNTVYANAQYFLGLSYYQLGSVAKATNQFENVEKTNPDNPEVQQILQNLRNGLEPLDGIGGAEEPQDRDVLPIHGE